MTSTAIAGWYERYVLLPGKSHGRRSLVGCSPRGHQESDTTEQLHFDFSLSCTGEGNGNPLQYSCLENPKDGEPGGLPSLGSHRVGHDWSDLAAASAAMGKCKQCMLPVVVNLDSWTGIMKRLCGNLLKFICNILWMDPLYLFPALLWPPPLSCCSSESRMCQGCSHQTSPKLTLVVYRAWNCVQDKGKKTSLPCGSVPHCHVVPQGSAVSRGSRGSFIKAILLAPSPSLPNMEPQN